MFRPMPLSENVDVRVLTAPKGDDLSCLKSWYKGSMDTSDSEAVSPDNTVSLSL
jgi:hypothetical protein